MNMNGVLMAALSGIKMEWTIGTFLTNLKINMTSWVNVVIMLIGLAMLGFAAYKIAHGLISKKGDTNWIMVVLLVVVGALLFANGTSSLSGLGTKGQEAIKGMGGSDASSTILMPFLGK